MATEAQKWALQHPEDEKAVAALGLYTEAQTKREAVKRPLEHHAPDVPGEGVMGYLKRLPKTIGISGGVENYYDPTMEDMLHTYGGKLPEGYEGREALMLADFRDAAWAAAYDKAKQEGRSVIRKPGVDVQRDTADRELGLAQRALGGLTFGLGPGLLQTGAKVIGDAATTIQQGVTGKPIGGRTKGDEWNERLRRTEADVAGDPTAAALEIGGGLLSPVNKLVGGAAKGLGIGTSESGLIGNVAKSAALGGATSVAAGTADDLTRSLEQLSRMTGGPEEHVTAMDNTLKDAPRHFLGGSALGAFGGAVSSLKPVLRSNDEIGRKLAIAEEAGAKTSVLKGIEYPENILAAKRESSTMGGDRTGAEPGRILAEDFSRELSPNVAAKQTEMAHRIFSAKESYLNTTLGNRVDPKPLANMFLEKARENYSRAIKENVPLAKPELFSDGIKALYEVKPVTAMEYARMPGYEIALEPVEAKALGIWTPPVPVSNLSPVTPATGSLKQLAGTVPGGGVLSIPPTAQSQGTISPDHIVLIRKKISPRDVERINDLAEEAASEAKRDGLKETEKSMLGIAKSAKETRELFPPNRWAPEELTATVNGKTVTGYAALMRHADAAVRQQKELLGRVGVSSELRAGQDPLSKSGTKLDPAEVNKGIESAAYGFKRGSPGRDRALEEMSKDIPGSRSSLFSIPAARDMGTMNRAASLTGNLPFVGTRPKITPGSATGLGTAALFHLDPILDPVARALRGGLPAAQGQHTSPEELQKLLELSRQLQQQGAR